MKNPFINEVIAKAATNIGRTLLINNVIDSATKKSTNMNIPNIVALLGSSLSPAEGYKIIVKKNVIINIKGIMTIVLAKT